MAGTTSLTCFVIMPFGEKTDVGGETIDFDVVYEHIIRKPIESLGLKCIRCDEILEAGQIHKKMFQSIHGGDVAVVDITTLNANVFYELGIRHSLRPAVTVLIRKRGTSLPFNIQGIKVIDYDMGVEGADKAREKIAAIVKNGLSTGRGDSPVLDALPQVQVTDNPTPLSRCEIFYAALQPPNDNRRIALVTGDIRDAKNVADVWVNSENTNMQMARFYDASVSAIIRYLGAKKSFAGHVEEDTVAEELNGLMGAYDSVPPATVIPTGAGALAKTHGVKRIFHAATHQGEVGRGYSPVQRLSDCVTRALEKMDELSDEGLASILFPLMGTRWGVFNLRKTASDLLLAAIAYLQNNPESGIETVYFLMYSDKERDACRQILEKSDAIVETTLTPVGRGRAGPRIP